MVEIKSMVGFRYEGIPTDGDGNLMNLLDLLESVLVGVTKFYFTLSTLAKNKKRLTPATITDDSLDNFWFKARWFP